VIPRLWPRAAAIAAVILALGGIVAGAAAQPTPPLTRTFHSAPFLGPPVITKSGRVHDPGQGDIFADVQNSTQTGPLILSPSGGLLWFEPLTHSAAFNVEVQKYQGQSVLTYWQGYVTGAGGIGNDYILNHHYQRIATVKAADGLYADLHDFQITPNGDALITVFQVVPADLRSVGGPAHGTLRDSVIQEIDIATGQLVWQWHAYGHIPLTDSYERKPTTTRPYDFFHINSIQQLPNGDLLVSARNTFAVYEINPATGNVVWTLGGKHSTFKIERGANFEYQHDAHLYADGTMTVFDDAAAGGDERERESRALVIRMNWQARKAELVRAYTNEPAVLSQSEGSVQVLPDRHAFVSWGSTPYFTEYGTGGRQQFSLHFPLSMQTYRGYRFQWWGQPYWPPSIAVSPTKGATTVYASWNGATDVAFWRVLAGGSTASMDPVGRFAKTGFETRMSVPSTRPKIEVQALDQNGHVLSTSLPASR
jgi:hypothetical protein